MLSPPAVSNRTSCVQNLIKHGSVFGEQGASQKEPSFGAQVNAATTTSELLEAAAGLAQDGQEFLSEEQKHKRYRNSCSALAKLAKMLTGSKCRAQREAAVADARFLQLCAAASGVAQPSRRSPAYDEDVRSALSALRALALLAPLPAAALPCAEALAAGVVGAAPELPPHLTSGALWSAQRLELDFPALAPLQEAYDKLALPFRISHGLLNCVPASPESAVARPARSRNNDAEGWGGGGGGAEGRGGGDAAYITLELLRREIPFVRDKLVTRDGTKVDERRETCWMAEPGVGGLAYSGV